jgi:hypothetical protein
MSWTANGWKRKKFSKWALTFILGYVDLKELSQGVSVEHS